MMVDLKVLEGKSVIKGQIL